MNKTVKIQFRLTEEEATRLKKNVRKTKLTMSSRIRMLLSGYEPREAPPMEFYYDLNRLYDEAYKMELTSEILKDPDIKKNLYDTSKNITEIMMDIRRKYLSPNKTNIKFM